MYEVGGLTVYDMYEVGGFTVYYVYEVGWFTVYDMNEVGWFIVYDMYEVYFETAKPLDLIFKMSNYPKQYGFLALRHELKRF